MTDIQIPWDKINTVFLDMDGTLLDLAYDNFFWLTYLPEQYTLKHKCSLATTQAELAKFFHQSKGTLDWYCTDYWSKKLSLDIASLKKNTQHLIQERPDTQPLLNFLKQSNKQIILLTNAHPDSLKIKMKKTGIAHFFDQMISSHSLGFAKEQAPFWQQLEKQLSFDKQQTLFIDDHEPILCTAQGYGIEYLYTMHQPDSKQAPKETMAFPAIVDFRAIIPKK